MLFFFIYVCFIMYFVLIMDFFSGFLVKLISLFISLPINVSMLSFLCLFITHHLSAINATSQPLHQCSTVSADLFVTIN
jgi:hypothetical protein